jgi:hypothetical protein
VLVHPFNWKKASMAAALCYGVRGGGAQLAFHVRAGSYDTDSIAGRRLPDRRWWDGALAAMTQGRRLAAAVAALALFAGCSQGGRAARRAGPGGQLPNIGTGHYRSNIIVFAGIKP